MRADAGLHADPTRRQIGQPGLHLAARPFLPQHDGTALVLANDVERVLADIDADYGGARGAGFCDSAVTLFLGPPPRLFARSEGRGTGKRTTRPGSPGISA